MTQHQPLFDFIRTQYPSREQIFLHEPVFGGQEEHYLQQTLSSRVVSTVGALVGRFEQQLATSVGVAEAVALSSGTSALHLSLKMAGLQAGQEVITQALTYVATVNPITYEGPSPSCLQLLVAANVPSEPLHRGSSALRDLPSL